jgi:hypothetical protein
MAICTQKDRPRSEHQHRKIRRRAALGSEERETKKIERSAKVFVIYAIIRAYIVTRDKRRSNGLLFTSFMDNLMIG